MRSPPRSTRRPRSPAGRSRARRESSRAAAARRGGSSWATSRSSSDTTGAAGGWGRLDDRYFDRPPRPFAELAVSESLRAAGVLTPASSRPRSTRASRLPGRPRHRVALSRPRSGGASRPGLYPDAERAAAVETAGRTVGRARRGLDHPDLRPRNLFLQPLGAPASWDAALLDLDRARIAPDDLHRVEIKKTSSASGDPSRRSDARPRELGAGGRGGVPARLRSCLTASEPRSSSLGDRRHRPCASSRLLLKAAAPCLAIEWVTQPVPGEIAGRHPGRRPAVDARSRSRVAGYRELSRALHGRRFDLVIDLQVYAKASLVTALLDSPARSDSIGGARASSTGWSRTSGSRRVRSARRASSTSSSPTTWASRDATSGRCP